VAARAASAFSFASSREGARRRASTLISREVVTAAAIGNRRSGRVHYHMVVTFATVVLIIRLAVPGEDLHDFYPGDGRDDNMIGFLNAHDCEVAARLVASIHKGPIEASCYEWDPFEHELGEKFSETSRPDS
jgi:hypothetical protein